MDRSDATATTETARPCADDTSVRPRRTIQTLLGVKRARDNTQSPTAPKKASAATTAPSAKRARPNLDPSACVTHMRGVLTAAEAREAMDDLRREVTTSQGQVRVYGRVLDEARLTAYHVRRQWADPRLADRPYIYSGKAMAGAPDFTPVLERLCCRVEDALGKPRGTYTAVLINEYRDGDDHISWHSDDEHSINRDDIASLSLGAARDFKMRDKTNHTLQVTFPLGSGDVVHMHGACQDLYQHQVPKRARVHGVRFNLTFRQLADHSAPK
ncbi:alkylated DNA repair [Pandoravirus quercus]|uniref:Dioxygenase n=2 Tax=Pandoravirus TaxID=2060084 RepID=A0A2U7U9Y6_9VIRU|nr:alkylated DNA repair [Pandoravirus quercus]AVK75253.1 Dioxygenase [Pandoravirus quercus]QBZ81426.1 2OG-Fe(II) oxygenase domain containing protein [Pandoravirus celtis]